MVAGLWFAAAIVVAVAVCLPAAAAKPKGVQAVVTGKTLQIAGTKKDDEVLLRRGKGKKLEIDTRGSAKAEFVFKLKRFRQIVVLGKGGNDAVPIDESKGPITTSERTTVNGGDGNDRLAGGLGAVTVNGDAGDDQLTDGPGGGSLAGGDGNDQLTGGSGAGALGGGNGNDRLAAGPGSASLDGGAGDDQITGGPGTTSMDGGPGDDTLNGGPGAESLNGGEGNDRADGNGGDDTAHLGAGDDSFQLDAGDGSDQLEGEAGQDRLLFNGTAADETVQAASGGGRLALSVDAAATGVDADGLEALTLNMLAGSDALVLTDLAGAGVGLASLDLGGGDGATDTVVVNGTTGADALTVSGSGTAFSVGGLSSLVEVASADAGVDRLTLNGSGGADGLTVDGTDAGEAFDLSPSGARLQLTGAVPVIDAGGFTALAIHARGGADTINVNDLAGAGVAQLSLGLESAPGSGSGDGQPDGVTLGAGAGNDTLAVTGSGAAASVSGLAVATSVVGNEAVDELVVRALGGADAVNASGFTGTLGRLTLDGGDAVDALTGSAGADVVIGGPGNDNALLGGGNDDFVWNAGDGTDTVEGQGGSSDRLLLFGSAANDDFQVFPNATRLGAVVNGVSAVDGAELERIEATPLGGADTVFFDNLATTAVTQAAANLGTGGGSSGDGAVDGVTVNATQIVDNVEVTGSAAGVNVTGTGIAPPMTVTGSDGTSDRLTINLLGGFDTIDASTLAAGAIGPVFNGGVGDDTLIGSPNADLFNGGMGLDLALMGAGDDTFTWNPGDGSDTLEGQAGLADRMLFNGANVNDGIEMSANGGRLRFFRNIATVTMDADNVEVIDFNASGAADTILIQNLAATDVDQVNIDLAAGGTTNPDGAADTVEVHGTDADDAFVLAGNPTAVNETGSPAAVSLRRQDPAMDQIILHGGAGNDTLDTTGLEPNSIQFTLLP
jgi:hypothetical protein